MYSNPLYAKIDSFESYLASLDKDTRGIYRRGLRDGLRLERITVITPEIYDSIMDVYLSKSERQGRLMNTLYHLITGESFDLREGWPNSDYSTFTCKKHYFDFRGCYLGDKLVAFIELLHAGDLVSVYSFMGHADYLKIGVTKFLLIETIRDANIKYLHYGNADTLPSMISYLKDLKIDNTNPSFVYQLANE